MAWWTELKMVYNSTYPKSGGSCFNNCYVVNQTFIFQIKYYKSSGQQPNIK
jgi:hypothetical protein